MSTAIDHNNQYIDSSPSLDSKPGDGNIDQYYIKDSGYDDKIYDTLESGNRDSSEPDEELSENAKAVKLMKTTSWINTFFLITTDILGPANAPYAIASMGYVPGVLLYFIFGLFAGYAGFILMKLFVQFDTERNPVRYDNIQYCTCTIYPMQCG